MMGDAQLPMTSPYLRMPQKLTTSTFVVYKFLALVIQVPGDSESFSPDHWFRPSIRLLLPEGSLQLMYIWGEFMDMNSSLDDCGSWVIDSLIRTYHIHLADVLPNLFCFHYRCPTWIPIYIATNGIYHELFSWTTQTLLSSLCLLLF
jgi:hypothetical protein